MANAVLDPAPNRDDLRASSWGRWFNQVYAVVQNIFSGATFTNPTLTGTVTCANEATFAGRLFSTANTGTAPLAPSTMMFWDSTLSQGVLAAYNNGTGVGLPLALNRLGGRVMVGTNADNGVDQLQVAGSITASGAVNGTLGGWKTWTPTWAGGGSMTVSVATLTDASYFRLGPLCFFQIYATLTLGGTASTFLSLSLPVAVQGQNKVVTSYLAAGSNTAWVPAWTYLAGGSSNAFLAQQQNFTFALGTLYVILEGFYHC